jgi:hypothetical protein
MSKKIYKKLKKLSNEMSKFVVGFEGNVSAKFKNRFFCYFSFERREKFITTIFQRNVR